MTGAAGVAAFPVASWLARENKVWGAARFSAPQSRAKLERAGITPCSINLAVGDLSDLPSDFDYVVHFAWSRGASGQFEESLRINAEGTGLVLRHCRTAKAALVVSSTAIYSPHPDTYHRYMEADPIGRECTIFNPTSTVSKIGQEVIAKFCAHTLDLPVTIARLSTVFGPPTAYQGRHVASILKGELVRFAADPHPHTPIHSDDMKDQLEALLEAASVPALVVNWGGDEVVTAQEWCRLAGRLVGKDAKLGLIDAPGYPAGHISDNTLRLSITGPCKTPFRTGMEKLVTDVRAMADPGRRVS